MGVPFICFWRHMKLLDAVNLIMPKLGERPVTSLDVKHPTLSVLIPIINKNRTETLLRGWWFNEYAHTAHPDPDGVIRMGRSTLRFIPNAHEVNAVMRGSELFNPETLTNVFKSPVSGVVTQDVEFDLLPESAANYVLYTSLIEMFATDIGMSQELQIWQVKAGDAWNVLLGEHLRHRKYSTRDIPAWRRLRRAMQA